MAHQPFPNGAEDPTLLAVEKGKRLENLQAKRNLVAERIDAAARAAGFWSAAQGSG